MLGFLLFIVNIYSSHAVDAVVGSNATLTCPFLPGAWNKRISGGWTPLQNGQKYANVNTAQLIILNVQADDSGDYACNSRTEGQMFYLNVIVNSVPGQNAILTCPFQPGAWNKKSLGGENWTTLTEGSKYENVKTSQLTIKNVDNDDSGQYLCNSKTEGYDTYLYVVVVTSNSTVLKCPYTRTDYVWHRYTKNNWITLFANDSKFGNVNSNQLTIFNVDAVDHGQYNCTRDIVQAVIFLYVIVMPLNVQLNQNYLAIIGGNVTLDCIVTGYPVASDIWWTDGQGTKLSGTRYSDGNLFSAPLTIQKVVALDTGQYICHATNTAGTNNRSTHLETGYTPYAEVALKQYALKTGDNVTIECKVMYADAVQWYKNGTILSADTKYNFIAIQNKDLVIYNVSTTDRDRYECRVTNKFGKDIDETLLKVVDTVIPISNYEKKANESVILQCFIYDATEVKWRFNEEYIPTESGRYSGGSITEPSLTITKLTRDDTGTYQCESLLESVSSVSGNIELKIRDKPLVKSFEENVIAIIGKDTIMQCSFDSYPKPTGVSWMKDGNILNVEDRSKYNGSNVQIPSLTIYNVNYTDSGTYVCYVENLIGRSSGKSVKLVVQVAEPMQSDSIIGPVAGGVSGGIVVVVLVVLAVFIYSRRKWTNTAQSNNYETQNSAKVELHLYDETQRPSNSTHRKSLVYVTTSKELTSSQIDMNATFTMYDARDFMLILQDKSALSKHIRKEYEVLNSRSMFTVAKDYEVVDVKTGATTAEEFISKALIKKMDDRNGYIITTVPGQSDIDNFWNMIFNYHLSCIVLMMQEAEKIFEFFPNTIEPINTNTFKVEICSVDKLPNKIFVFVLDISNKVKNTVVQVKLYRTTDWKAGEIHPSIDTMCTLLDVISSVEPGMVALMGSQVIGFPVCGNLGACHEVLHALHNEKDFNILQIVFGLKHIQPDLFQTFEEYNLSYKVIDHFLQNEHTYAVID